MKDAFEIKKEIEEVEKEIDGCGHLDAIKREKLLEKLDKLEKEYKAALEEMVERYAQEMKKRDEEYGKIDFNDLPLFLMNYCRSNIWNGKLTVALRTDDFGYGKWEEEVPKEWLDEAIASGDKKKALDKYFDVMGKLEELFSRLCYFSTDVSDYFPEQKIYIKLPEDEEIQKSIDESDLPCECSNIICMDYVVGQGSDFSIDLVDIDQWKKLLVEKQFFFEWEDAVKVSKMSGFEQAQWYCQKLLESEAAETIKENKDKVFFILGQASAKSGFTDKLNLRNYKEVLI